MKIWEVVHCHLFFITSFIIKALISLYMLPIVLLELPCWELLPWCYSVVMFYFHLLQFSASIFNFPRLLVALLATKASIPTDAIWVSTENLTALIIKWEVSISSLERSAYFRVCCPCLCPLATLVSSSISQSSLGTIFPRGWGLFVIDCSILWLCAKGCNTSTLTSNSYSENALTSGFYLWITTYSVNVLMTNMNTSEDYYYCIVFSFTVSHIKLYHSKTHIKQSYWGVQLLHFSLRCTPSLPHLQVTELAMTQ